MSSGTLSLTLQSVLKTSISRIGVPDKHLATVGGLSPAAQALLVAHSATVSATVLVVPTDHDVELITEDARFFHAALSGLSQADAKRVVLPFPSPEVDPYRGINLHLDVASARARVLAGVAQGTARLIVASVEALLPRVTGSERLVQASLTLGVGGELSPSDLSDVLADAGFRPEDPVDQHGEFCVRGGMVDYFPVGERYPVRVEFAGDRIESIREFDPANQRSVKGLDRTSVIPLREILESSGVGIDGTQELDRSSSLLEYLGPRTTSRTFVRDFDECEKRVLRFIGRINDSHAKVSNTGEIVPTPEEIFIDWTDVRSKLESGTRFETLEIDNPSGSEQHNISCQQVIPFHGRLSDWVDAVRRGQASEQTQLLVATTPGRAERISELLAEHDLVSVPVAHAESTHAAVVLIAQGVLSRGFRLPEAGIQFYSEADLFDEERRIQDRRKSVSTSFLSDLRDLKVGDRVVHGDHGIGAFVGLTQMDVAGISHELLELQYVDGDKLFVPVENLDLVQKYTGGQYPKLDRLGGTNWERAKTRVKRAMRNMAGELLKLYAARQAVVGHTFGPDTHWQEEFESSFKFELTKDQIAAVAEVKQDMESATPMDRLLCGDVGYGKTEVALRAAFKAVMEGKQVALLAPTTVLAFQHAKTMAERFAAFPIQIDTLSRFRSRAEQKATLMNLAGGKVDIIVGTHRILSKDVDFHNLGLLIVDEEQRFGVAHKERIKGLRRKVDVLTLTATPIPRTLNMSLVGIRDMSIIETPPKDRLSIQTNVVKFDPGLIAIAIRNELDRGGQVYFVHNRINSISAIADLIRRLVPEARLAVAHGRSGEVALEKVMIGFVEHEFDVLLSTTIIENGLDIPNVNTIIVNHAERYGLAQLYQLRGRVGRSDRRAYAYLMTPQENELSQVAKQRLAAIKEFSDLGSGFRIAALDLEIRGAGNLLGAEQSGQIEAIGFDMYVKLLERAVQELKGEEIGEGRRTVVNLGIQLRIDSDYIPETNQRLALYRRVAASNGEEELSSLQVEVADRYGPVPETVKRLFEFGRLRLLADRLGIESISREKHVLVLRFRDKNRINPRRMIELVQIRSDMTLVPPGFVRVDLAVSQDGGEQDLAKIGPQGLEDSVIRSVAALLSELSGDDRA